MAPSTGHESLYPFTGKNCEEIYYGSAVSPSGTPLTHDFFGWVQGGSKVMRHLLVPDPNIAGIGVLLSFLLSAAFVLIFSIVAFWTGLLPENLVSQYDQRFFRAKPCKRRYLSRAFQKCIYAFSDQQIITGIAILIAGHTNNDISTYHWLLLTYSAWISSNIHLLSLTVIGDALRNFTFALIWRSCGMLCLFILLLIALLPTLYDYNRAFPFIMYPVRCAWNYPKDGHIPYGALNNALALGIFIIGYLWKVSSVFIWPGRFRRWLRVRPGKWLKTKIQRRARNRWSWTWTRYIPFRPYYLLLTFYAMFILLFDFVHSFSFAICLMILSTTWGTLNIVSYREMVRIQTDPVLFKGENRWDYGQVLPMLLLLIPLLTIVEQFSHAMKLKKHEDRPGSLALEFAAFDGKSETALVREGTYVSSIESPPTSTSPPKTKNKNGDGKFLSRLFLNYDAVDNLRCEISPEHDYLYSSKCFFVAHLMLMLYLILSEVFMFVALGYISKLVLAQIQYWLWAVIFLAVFPTTIFLFLSLAMPFSKLGR